MSSGFQYILYEENNRSSIITINRPDLFNALNAEAKYEVMMAIREANKNEAIRSIILTGMGRAFCTGQDLNDRNIQSQHTEVDLGQTLETEWNPLINSIRDSKKVVIAALNGTCAGAGMAIALACDFIIASPTVKFVSAFSKLALVSDAGSTHALVRALGKFRTMEFCLLQKPLPASELLSLGLINAIDEEVLERAKQIASVINTLSPVATTMAKKNIQSSLDLDFNESMMREVHSQRFLGKSNDYKEGLNAFLEKRTPQFTGN